MRDGIDCQEFRERLDELRAGGLSPETREKMVRHTESCAVCATTLRVSDHLDLSGRDLEAEIPAEHVGNMWPRVQGQISGNPSRGPHRSDSRRTGWVPALAAAAVLLIAGNLFLTWQLRQVQERERRLVERVESHERRLAELDASIAALDPRAHTATLAATRSWERMLGRIDRIRVAELAGLLATLPPGTTLLGTEDLERVRADRLAWPRWGATRRLNLSDGLQADELLRLIEELRLDPDRTIATDRILDRIRRLSS